MMTRRWSWIVVPIAVVALTDCARAKADEEGLRDSFADRIVTTNLVTEFARHGADLTFSGPDREGGISRWLVRINSSLVEPIEFDNAMPYQGRITSEWYVNDEIVEYLGTMTALPQEFLDRGLGQECWAYWVEAEHRWDW